MKNKGILSLIPLFLEINYSQIHFTIGIITIRDITGIKQFYQFLHTD